jgi:outer membrane protein assembly factor BamB
VVTILCPDIVLPARQTLKTYSQIVGLFEPRMKKPRFFSLLTVFLLASFLLSACGGTLINSWPGVSTNEDTIYISYQGSVYAINAENGAQVWRFPSEPDPQKPFYAAPGFGPNGLAVVGNYGHVLYGINPNGSVAWQFTAPNGNFAATPLVLENMVLAPASDGSLYALSPDGKKVWEYDTGNILWAQPASDGELVFLPGVDHKLYALRLADGQPAWTADLGSALLSAPVLGEDLLYVTTLEGQVVAVNPATGDVVWDTPTENRIWSSPALHEGVLYVGNANGKTANSKTGQILALSAEDGSIIWEQSTDSPVIGGAVVLPDAVVFPTEAGNLVAWALDGQKQLWSQPVNGKLYTTPVVAGDTLAVAVSEGDNLIQAFAPNGQMTWAFAMPK